jgi:tRNA nucleotidyltransferase/poly(A) polymerase
MIIEGLIPEKRVKMDFNLPQDILQIKDVFQKNKFKLYVVGGSVRDLILNKEPKDFDLATDAVPDKVEEMMAKAGFKTLPTGKQFGVINVFTKDNEYEIATFRKDIGSSDGRRPDSVEFTSIEGDVSRRDLTINALFYDIETKEVVDLVGGIDDIKNGVVRTVGKPEDRFNEDKLRILRAIRFAARFGNKLDSATDAALKKDANLGSISGERIRDEFIKGLQSTKSTKHFLEMLLEYNLFRYIFQGLNVDLSTLKNLKPKEEDYIVLLSRLLHSNNVADLKKVLNERKYSVDEIKAITFLVSLQKLNLDTAPILKKAQEHAGVTPEQIKAFAFKMGLDMKLINAFLKYHLSISGAEVMEKTGLKQGKELGVEINRLEREIFLNIFKNT